MSKNANRTAENRQNPDSDGLGMTPTGTSATIGYVDEVNGPDATLVPEFVPTRAGA